MKNNRKIMIRLPEELYRVLKELDTNVSKLFRQAVVDKIKKIKSTKKVS